MVTIAFLLGGGEEECQIMLMHEFASLEFSLGWRTPPIFLLPGVMNHSSPTCLIISFYDNIKLPKCIIDLDVHSINKAARGNCYLKYIFICLLLSFF